MGGLAATPVALIVGMICRVRSLRPATRHVLWLATLASFLTPAAGMLIWRPSWFRSDLVLAAADRVLEQRSESIVPRDDARAHEGRGETLAKEGLYAGDGQRTETVWDGPGVAGVQREIGREGWIEKVQLGGPGNRANHARPRGSGAASHVHANLDVPLRDDGVIASSPGIVEKTGSQHAVGSSSISSAAQRGSAPSLAADPLGIPAMDVATQAAAPTLDVPDLMGTTAGIVELLARSSAMLKDTGREARGPEGGVAVTEPRDSRGQDFEGAGLESGRSMPVAAGASIRPWISRVLDVRDAISSLPPIPMTVWGGVAGVILALTAVRTLRVARWLRHGRPGGEKETAIVAEVAERMGLRRAPRIVMVDGSVSPMIWCGLRPRLVLPEALWRTLDTASRRAVVAHELAHVRRRDHILCWIECVIGAVYWWHPAVWWARWRMRDAAEASCDAWVTDVLPTGRRAYAAALVTTKSFLNSRQTSPGPCLGIMSGSAKRLARRITMVMTQRTAPRISMMGACAAAVVLAAGMFVTPGLACPPEDAPKAKKAAKVLMKGHVHAATPGAAASPGVSAGGEPGVTFLGEAPALEAMKAQGVPSHPGALAAPTGDPNVILIRPGQIAGFQGTMVTPRPLQPMQGLSATAPMAPKPPKAPKAPKAAKAAKAPDLAFAGQYVDLEALKVGRTPRSYTLAPGKLQAFYEFMSRNDIPVLVNLEDDHIVIWAKDDQHPVLESFVKMVDPSASGADVQNQRRSMRGTPRQREVTATGRAMSAEAQARAREEYHRALEQVSANRDKIQAEADAVRAKAEEARERAEQVRELSDELRERAQEIKEEQVRAALEQAHSRLQNRSDVLEQESRTMDGRLEDLEKRLEDIERRAEELADRLSSIDDEEDGNEVAMVADENPGAFVEGMEIGDVGDVGDIDDAGAPEDMDESEEVIGADAMVEPAPVEAPEPAEVPAPPAPAAAPGVLPPAPTPSPAC